MRSVRRLQRGVVTVTTPSPPHRQVGLALSGGGARCYAQVGALAALEEEGLRACAIAANSTAAILAAFYAAGHDARALEAIVRDVDFADFFAPDGATGLIRHDHVERLLERHAPETFEALAIPLAVPAVDIERAELLVYSQGPLRPPVCASNAFPGLFTPVEHEGRHLLDGGIINNFPVDVIRAMTSRPVVAIDVRPPPTGPLDLDREAPDTLVGKLAALFGRGVPNTVDVLIRAYTITQTRLLDVICALHPPDVWLRPPLPADLETQDFDRLDEALGIGYRCVKEAAAAGRFDALDGGDAG
jgi:NTE family protein